MSKRKGQTNGSTTQDQVSPAASGNAPEIDVAGTTQSADGPAVDTASFVAGSDGVDGAADGEGLSDAQTAGTTATETVQQPESGGLGDAEALSGGGEGSASSGGVEAAGGSDAGGAGPSDDHSGGSANNGDGGFADDADGRADGSATTVHTGHGAQSDGGSHDNGHGIVPPGAGAGDDRDGSQGQTSPNGSEISPDLKAALELAGYETVEDLIDMARVGSNLMGAIDDVRRCDGPFKDWAPAYDPVEIVHDLYAALEHAWEKTDDLKKSAPDDDKPLWLEMPNLAEDIDPLEISRFVARDVFVGVHGSVEMLGALINQDQPLETPSFPFEAVSELVDLVRRIGPRATPDVLAQHLVITKHRQSAELTKAEELGLKAFASILIDLDYFAAAEKKRLEDLSAEKPKPRPVPIDETNMELVDGPMATH